MTLFKLILVTMASLAISSLAFASASATYECENKNIKLKAFATDENNAKPATGETTLEITFHGIVIYYGDALTRRDDGKLVFQTINEEPTLTTPIVAAIGLSEDGKKSEFSMIDIRGKSIVTKLNCTQPRL